MNVTLWRSVWGRMGKIFSSFLAFKCFLGGGSLQDWVESRNTSGLYYKMAVLWQWEKMALKKKGRRIKREKLGNYRMEEQLQELS